jgi:hypothetical protein
MVQPKTVPACVGHALRAIVEGTRSQGAAIYPPGEALPAATFPDLRNVRPPNRHCLPAVFGARVRIYPRKHAGLPWETDWTVLVRFPVSDEEEAVLAVAVNCPRAFMGLRDAWFPAVRTLSAALSP